jgi:hypothetical protein
VHAADLEFTAVEQIAAKLGNATRLLVVGGQALNFWADRYSSRVPELRARAPFTSKDVDFFGTAADVRSIAKALGGNARVAGFDDHAPQIGTVTFSDEQGIHTIDIMASLTGLDFDDVVESAVDVAYPVANGKKIALRIMHPVLVLESRAHNVVASPKYRTTHGIGQLEASVYCAREYLREMIASKPHAVLEWNERLYQFRTKNRVAHYVSQHYGIDVFDSVVTGPELNPIFISKRYPQMLERVNALRTNEAARRRRSKDSSTP